jgi:hypothetical protein
MYMLYSNGYGGPPKQLRVKEVHGEKRLRATALNDV